MHRGFEACQEWPPELTFVVTASKVIEEIKHLPPSEQVQVIQFALDLARTRQLTPQELATLAEQLASSEDPAEIIRLKAALTSGFYGV
jgi:hypothetical protein